MRRSDRRIIIEGLVVVLVLLPIHFLVERPRPTALSTVLVLLVFFLPPAWAAVRLESRGGSLVDKVLRYLGFGLVLGVSVGFVGGLLKGLLHLVTGEPLRLPPGLWIGIALLFALATGLAYGVMLCLVRGMGALLREPSPEAVASLSAGLPRASGRMGLLYNVIPGLGHFALGRPDRGRLFLFTAVASGLSGLVILIVGLILLVEGGIPTLPLLALGAGLLFFPLLLVLAAAFDMLFLQPS